MSYFVEYRVIGYVLAPLVERFKVQPSEAACKSVARFLEHLDIDSVRANLEKALSRLGDTTADDVFRYFCGICWKEIKVNAQPMFTPAGEGVRHNA
jgi:hypothetical protein